MAHHTYGTARQTDTRIPTAASGRAARRMRLLLSGILLFGLGTGGALFAAASTPANNSLPAARERPAGDGNVRGSANESSEPTDHTPRNSVPESDSIDSDTTVRVNGQNIPVPENGSVHKTVPTEGGHTSIDIDQHTSSSGGQQSSSTRIEVESRSSSTSSGTDSSSSRHTRRR